MAQGHRCTVCAGACKGGYDHSSLHLHVEIENLKQKLLERDSHIVTMETNILTEVDKFPNGEYAAVADELLTWKENYARLLDAHRRIQKVNQSLEDKLLKIVDKCETEKFNMAREMTGLKQRLVDTNVTIATLKEENERNRNDVNLAIQLLQCKPSNFVSQKFESLPSDLQQKVKVYVTNKKKMCDGNTPIKHEVKTIKVPIPTFPPTAMFYSVNKSNGDDEEYEETENGSVDIVSAAIVAKILEEREKERQNTRHCDSCICPTRRNTTTSATQTRDYIGLISADADIIRVESYQSASPAVSSVTLIERSPMTVTSTGMVAGQQGGQQGDMSSHQPHQPLVPHHHGRRADGTTLNLGRNRYHSSKLSREVNRRREKAESDLPTLRHSEIHIDDSGEVSCDIADVRLKQDIEKVDEEANRRGHERRSVGCSGSARRCSISIHSGASSTCGNMLLDSVTSYVPTPHNQPARSYPFVHSSRSSSASSMEEGPTETQI